MFSHRYSTLFRRFSILFVLTLVAAACASDSTTDPAPATSAAQTEATPAATEPAAAAAPAATEAADDHMDDSHDEDAAEHMDESADEHMDESMSDDMNTSTGEPDRVVEVVMTEFAFSPDSLNVTAGETIKFIVTNEGAVPHELRFSNSHRIEEHLASGHEGHDEEGGHHGEADVLVLVDPGVSEEMTVTFPEDATFFTEMVCLIEGHYEAGMKGLLTYN